MYHCRSSRLFIGSSDVLLRLRDSGDSGVFLLSSCGFGVGVLLVLFGLFGGNVTVEVGRVVDVFEHAAVSQGKESGTDSTDEGSEQVDSKDGGVESLLLNLVLEGREGDRNGRVKRGTGVGSGNKDHGG